MHCLICTLYFVFHDTVSLRITWNREYSNEVMASQCDTDLWLRVRVAEVLTSLLDRLVGTSKLDLVDESRSSGLTGGVSYTHQVGSLHTDTS